VSEARVVCESDLAEYNLTEKTLEVIEKALAWAKSGGEKAN
jgi:hypothetical protein